MLFTEEKGFIKQKNNPKRGLFFCFMALTSGVVGDYAVLSSASLALSAALVAGELGVSPCAAAF
jgi:hypothetical protein